MQAGDAHDKKQWQRLVQAAVFAFAGAATTNLEGDQRDDDDDDDKDDQDDDLRKWKNLSGKREVDPFPGGTNILEVEGRRAPMASTVR